MDDFMFFLPTRVIFGPGSIKGLRRHIDKKYKNILIVTDSYLHQNTNIIKNVKEGLGQTGILVFDDIEENPSYETVEKGGLFAKNNGCDLVLGVGGGSSMDAAKGIAISATNTTSLRNIVRTGVLSNDPLAVCCIPTTSGTGSEVTPFAVFSDLEAKTKDGYGDDKIFPEISIIDPELSYSAPGDVVINTGLDVLAHSVEAFLSIDSSDLSDTLALRAIELCYNNLSAAVNKDRQAQVNMSYASMLAGIAITHASTILPHIMGYPLTVFHKIPHGRASALILAPFITYMRENKLLPDKINKLDELAGSGSNISDFIRSLGVSVSLADYGVTTDEISVFIQKTIIKGDVKITPGNISEEVIREIYQKAL